jgi:protein O-mannosyl-transferase
MSKPLLIFKYPKLTLIILVFVLYGNTLKNTYALDDNVVTGPDCITSKGFRSIPKIFRSFYADKTVKNKFEYRPLVKISFAVEHQLFGVKAGISHFFNLVLYCICLLVLLQWLKIVFRNYPTEFSVMIVVLFAILPIHTEVVASLKNRDILLSFLFSISGSLYFFKAITGNGRRIINVILSVLCFYLAFLSKLDVITFLAIVPVIALVEFRSGVKWAFGFLLVFIMALFIFKLTRFIGLEAVHGTRTLVYFENPLFFEKGVWFRIIASLNTLGFYVLQIVFPFSQSSYYGYKTIPVTEFSPFYGVLGLLFYALIIYGLIWSLRKKENALFIGVFIFITCISMYLNLVMPSVGIVADRFSFNASLGISIFAMAGYYKLSKNKIKFGTNEKGVALLITAVFGVMIIQRNTQWKDLETLIMADVKKCPESVFLNYKAGAIILQAQKARNNSQLRPEDQKAIAEAKAHFEKAISVYPDYPDALNYLSYVLIFMYNDFPAALPHVEHSLKLEYSTEVLYYKAICYRETNKKDSSEVILLECIKNDPGYQNAYDLLVYDYITAKQFDKSIRILSMAIDKGIANEKLKAMLEQSKALKAKETEIK